MTRDLFGKTLVWHRPLSSNNARLPTIKTIQRGNVPSWLWMSRNGPVTYFELPWLEDSLITWMTDFELALLGGPRSILDRTARFVLTAPLMRLQLNCRLEQEESPRINFVCIYDGPGPEQAGWIYFDGEDVLNSESLGFVRIAQFATSMGALSSQTFSVGLVVQPLSTLLYIAKMYRRLGFGILLTMCLVPDPGTTVCVL